MVVPGLTEVRSVAPLVPPPAEGPVTENITKTEDETSSPQTEEVTEAASEAADNAQSAAATGGPEAGLRSLAAKVTTMATKSFTRTAESFKGMKENFNNKTAEKDLKQERQDYEINKEIALENQTNQIKQRGEELQGENGAQIARDALKAKGYQEGTPLTGENKWSVQTNTIDTTTVGEEEISFDAAEMSSDPRYQKIRQEKINQFMEANNLNEIDPAVQQYIEGSLDPRKSNLPYADSDAERAFRQNFPESAKQYDQKEATLVRENYSKDPVLRKLQQEAARKASFSDKVRETQLGSSQEKYDQAWQEAYDSEAAEAYEDFVTQYPEKAKAYFVQGHEGIKTALNKVVVRDENINAFLDAKIAGRAAQGEQARSGRDEIPAGTFAAEGPSSANQPTQEMRAIWHDVKSNKDLHVKFHGVANGKMYFSSADGRLIPQDELEFMDNMPEQELNKIPSYQHTGKEQYDNQSPFEKMGGKKQIAGEPIPEGYHLIADGSGQSWLMPDVPVEPTETSAAEVADETPTSQTQAQESHAEEPQAETEAVVTEEPITDQTVEEDRETEIPETEQPEQAIEKESTEEEQTAQSAETPETEKTIEQRLADLEKQVITLKEENEKLKELTGLLAKHAGEEDSEKKKSLLKIILGLAAAVVGGQIVQAADDTVNRAQRGG